jgi:iron-sulfur cluster repair protein YtfE (RIC family)
MDDLELLSDDHALLGSQVIHVVALLKSLSEARLDTAALTLEIMRQIELLGSQLAEHFAFEEVTVFPQLTQKYPASSPRFQNLLAQHAEVLAAFKGLISAIPGDSESPNYADTIAKSALFESAFERHAREETELLRDLAATPAQGSVHK